MYNAGRNKVKAEFYDREELEEVINEVGEYEQKHKLICVDWVELLPQTGREFIQNRKDEHEMNYRFKMRRRNDIEVDDYVKFNGVRAEIIYIAPYMDHISQGRYMEVVVKWQSLPI